MTCSAFVAAECSGKVRHYRFGRRGSDRRAYFCDACAAYTRREIDDRLEVCTDGCGIRSIAPRSVGRRLLDRIAA